MLVHAMGHILPQENLKKFSQGTGRDPADLESR